MEEDELREVVENLANLVEDYRAIKCGDSSEEENGSGSDDIDY